MRNTTLAIAALGIAVATGEATAGGLARPNPISARGIGMGGAFVAVADDPTALHFNPAGIALLAKSMVLIGGEFIVAPRTYTPTGVPGLVEDCDDMPDFAACQPQSPSSPVRPLPVLGWVSRLKDEGVPSRLSFGVGVWNTFGGQLEYDLFRDEDGEHLDQIPALNETRNAVIEIVPGVAYEINDVLAIGAAFRLGFGLFNAKTTAKPSTADLAATGLGAGATFGLMLRPYETLQIGAVYRTSLTNKLKGDGEIRTSPTTVLDVDVKMDQRWPQEAGIGFQWRANDRIRLMGEFDWTNWSRLNTLEVRFSGAVGAEELNQTFILDWNDNWSLHAGVELAATDTVDLRAGYTYDTTAVPDKAIERQFLDSNKMLAAVGASWAFSDSWRLDTAFESSIPLGARKIENNCGPPDNLCDVLNGANTSPVTRANAAPGEHKGRLFTFELAVQYLY